jgi:plastin-1
MQYHIVSKLKAMSFGGKEVTEESMVNWVNEKVKSAGKSTKIRSFKDPSLKDGLFLIDLLASIRPSAVNYKLVTPGKTGKQVGQLY